MNSFERFPQTRYTGSKRKLLPFLAEVFGELEFEKVLDPFSGTGSVAYLLKCLGKKVTASDVLESNVVAARALIQNQGVRLGNLTGGLVDGIPQEGIDPGVVERVFDEVFFEREENRFIDQVLVRINKLSGPGRDLALYSLFQACLSKRPYNLFHRANLSMRRRDVVRSFGNKATWDTPFDVHMKRFAVEADRAIFDSEVPCEAHRRKVEDVDPTGFDLVYLDPPYVSGRGAGVDYFDYYHFLEGLCAPGDWESRIVHRYKHKPLVGRGESPWTDKGRISRAFEEIVGKFADSTLVVSYRSDGIPSVEEIVSFMKKAGKKVSTFDSGKYIYALSTNKRSREVAVVGS